MRVISNCGTVHRFVIARRIVTRRGESLHCDPYGTLVLVQLSSPPCYELPLIVAAPPYYAEIALRMYAHADWSNAVYYCAFFV